MNDLIQHHTNNGLTNDDLLSKTIDFLRFPLTILVVYLHFNFSRQGITIHSITYGMDNPEWYYWIFDFISDTIARISVPLFFFFSGFLFYYRKEFNFSVYKQKVKTRIRTLFVPYILWNTIAILFAAALLLPIFWSIAPKNSQIEIHFSLQRLFHTFFTDFYNEGIFVKPSEPVLPNATRTPYPIDVSLWYVRDLIVMVIAAPAIHMAIKKFKKWMVVLSCVLWYICQAVYHVEGGWITQLTTALFFFSWGAYFSINKLNFVISFMKYKYVSLVYLPIAIVDVLTKGDSSNIYWHNVGLLLGIVAMVIIGAYLIVEGKVKMYPFLVNGSFFIFASHTIYMGLLSKVIFYVLKIPNNPWTLLGFYFVIPILTSIISLIIYRFLKRYLPSLCGLLTGGR